MVGAKIRVTIRQIEIEKIEINQAENGYNPIEKTQYQKKGKDHCRKGSDIFIENVHYIGRENCKHRRILLFSVEMLFHERLTVPGTSLRFFYFLSFYFFLSLFSTSCALLPLD